MNVSSEAVESQNYSEHPATSHSEGHGGGINVSWPLLFFVIIVSVLVGLTAVANQRCVLTPTTQFAK